MKRKNAYTDNPKPSDFDRIPGFKNFMGKKSEKNVNKANLFKQKKKADTSKTHFTEGGLIF